MMTLLLGFLIGAFALMTWLPLVKDDYWTFRIMEYPRVQKLIIGIALLVGTLAAKAWIGEWFWWFSVVIVLCNAYLIGKVYPYTSFSPKEMKRVALSNAMLETA
jgi:hypothetical protein